MWIKPLEDCMGPLREASLRGLGEGDFEFGVWSLFSHSMLFPYIMGKPLQSILNRCSMVLAQCEESGQKVHALVVRSLWQMLANLTDPSCPRTFDGEIYCPSSWNDDIRAHPGSLGFRHLATGEALLFNVGYRAAADRAIKDGDIIDRHLPQFYGATLEIFHRAVALYATALETHKRKYKKGASRIRKRIAKWAQINNPNAKYYLPFLDAEQLCLEKKVNEAQSKYQEALAVVGSKGYLHHLGLFHERYADFLSREKVSEEQSRYHLEEAMRYYKEWGHVGKVKTLEARLGSWNKQADAPAPTSSVLNTS